MLENRKLMAEFYEAFPRAHDFGFFKRENDEDGGYFCTPKDAEIIGWTGVDGIHLCFAPSLDQDMVFVVNPASSGSFVYPVARNFRDFLLLLVHLGEFAPLEQPVYNPEYPDLKQTRQAFLDFASQVKRECSNAHQRELLQLQKLFRLDTRMDAKSIYQYLYDLQSSFDYSNIFIDLDEQ